MQLFLSKEEKFHLEAITAKKSNLELQGQLLKQEMDSVIAEFCKKNSKDIKEAVSLNLEHGFIEFADETKKEKKK
jgi:hypothetical protein